MQEHKCTVSYKPKRIRATVFFFFFLHRVHPNRENDCEKKVTILRKKQIRILRKKSESKEKVYILREKKSEFFDTSQNS